MMEEACKKKPFQLSSLMDMEKDSLGLESFSSSEIETKMLRGNLEKGSQIWVFHNGQTDFWNPVAQMNRYSHVVVYVGSRRIDGQTVREFVHAAKDSMRGTMKAKITRDDIDNVIKTNDQVFLGHKVANFQFAGNLREKIAERALACVDED